MKRPIVALIVAAAENGVIGRDNALPWRIPEDMAWFKRHTMGKPCVMGRRTWESLPKRPLPGRTNIVVTRNPRYEARGAVVAASLDSALEAAAGERSEEIMILGGAEIFALALPQALRIYLTRVHVAAQGDVRFPELDLGDWIETLVSVHPSSEERPIGYSFVILDKKGSDHVRA